MESAVKEDPAQKATVDEPEFEFTYIELRRRVVRV